MSLAIRKVLFSRMRVAMEGVLIISSKAATRPLPSCRGRRSWESTAFKLPASCILTCSWREAGKASTILSTVRAAPVVCRVEKTRWPVSAAVMAISIVSRSRISPTRMTSGSWRKARRRPSAKLGTSTPTSRWFTMPSPWAWKYSMGSSMVMMCPRRSRLMTLSMLASDVVLPEPVGPVTSTRPRGRSSSLRTAGGRPISSSVMRFFGMSRNATPTAPRCRYTLARNRSSWKEKAKSTLPSSETLAIWSSLAMARASAAVSSGVSGGALSFVRLPRMRNAGGEPAERWRSEAFSSTTSRRRSSIGAADIEETPLVGVDHRGGDDFLRRGASGQDFAHAVLAQRPHAEFPRALADLEGRSAVVDHEARLVVDDQDFENPDPALVAEVAALVAADRFHDVCVAQLAVVDAQRAHLGFGEGVGLLALRAELADEALRHDGPHGTGDEERLHADIDEAGDGAGGVVGVESAEDEVAREAGVDGDVRRFHVANLADHDDVRRLAQHRAERRREGHADIRIDLHLVDACHLVLDGVFHGDDLAIRLVDVVEARVEGRGLARTGGARDEQDAVRQIEQALEDFLVVAEEAEFGQAEREARFVENTHDDALPVIGRDGRDAQVDRFLADLHLDAPVLRQALLGDAHRPGHDLEAADDGRLELLRRALHLVQHAVHAEPDAETFFQRLQVDVARPALVPFQQEHRHHLDDGRVARFLPAVAADGDIAADLDILAELFAKDIRRFLGAAVVFDEGTVDLARGGADEIQVALQDVAQVVERVEVERVVDGDHEARVQQRHGYNPVFPGDVAGDEGDDLLADRHLRQVHEVHRGVPRQRPDDVLLRDDPEVDQSGDDVAVLGLRARGIHLFAGYDPYVDQDLKDVFGVCHEDAPPLRRAHRTLVRGSSDVNARVIISRRGTVGDGARGSRADHPRVLGEDASGVTRGGRLPGPEAGFDFLEGKLHVDGALLGVDGYLVAVPHDGQRAAAACFRGYMPDDEPVAAAREPPVGYQGHVLAEAFAHHRGSGGQHLAHPRPAVRPFMAYDDDVALGYGAVQDFRQRQFLRLEHARRSAEAQPFLARDLRDCAGGRQVAVEDDEVALRLDRLFPGPDDALPRGIRLHGREVLRHRPARAGHAAAMQQPLVQQRLHQGSYAADLHQLRHEILPARLQVREHGNALPDLGEVVDLQRNAGGMGHREKMQHGVGRTAERDDHGDRVLERLARHDVERADALLQQVQHGLARAAAVIPLRLRERGLRGTVRQAHAERFDGRGHGVRRVHPAARTRARDGVLLDLRQFRVADAAVGVRADRFKNGNDVQEPPREAAGKDRAAIDEDRGPVQPRQSDEAPRHVLVATADGHDAVEAFARHHRLDGIRDDLARDEGIFHPFRPHRNAVGNRDRAEDDRLAPRRVNPCGGLAGEAVDVHVARGHHAPGRGYADLGSLEILAFETDGIKHRAAGGALRAVHDEGRKRTFGGSGRIHRDRYTSRPPLFPQAAPALAVCGAIRETAADERGDSQAPHIRHHLASRRGQDDADGEAAPVRRRGAARRFGDGAQIGPGRDLRLDGTRAQARHIDQFHGAPVRLRRLPPEPARHARPQGFLGGYVPRPDRRGRGGDGHRRRQGHREPDQETVRGLPPPRRAHLHFHEQAGPPRARSARSPGRTGKRARHRRVPGELAPRRRPGFPGCL